MLTGGEDDLVQVWSMEERKTVAWGEGHNSWVSLIKYMFLRTEILLKCPNKLIGRLVELLSIPIGRHRIQMNQEKASCIVLDPWVR